MAKTFNKKSEAKNEEAACYFDGHAVISGNGINGKTNSFFQYIDIRIYGCIETGL